MFPKKTRKAVIKFRLIGNACQAVKENGKSGELGIKATHRGQAFTDCLSPMHETVNSNGTRLEERVPVVITIQGNGSGIPADKLKDVFRPFYTTKAECAGLYITQQFVEKIRGTRSF